MASPVPFLQIVHISDLHFMDDTFPAPIRNFVRRWVRSFWPALHDWILDATALHDPDAPDLFADFLDEITVRSSEPEWANTPTCVVDSGDLTTFGDQASLDLGWNYLTRLGQGRRLVFIHGNHDAWPSTFPLFASGQSVLGQTSLLGTRYQVEIPSAPVTFPIPHGGGEVQLFTLDSIIHDNYLNSGAWGLVPIVQMDRLSLLIDSSIHTNKRNLRILIIHHPVHYPPPIPFFKYMINQAGVGQRLDSNTPMGAHPIVHLVLSGHIHAPFPEMGKLPANPQACSHPRLGPEQCQLIVGSLMQADKFGKRGFWPHQCQILRFYYEPSDQSAIFMDRLFAGRGAGLGPYVFVPDPKGTGALVERICFSI